ncbi:Nucleotide-binding alpha-beta plait [Penicillium brevicompactum]|uniref:Nucleotide-binding alpha-beta plait n=1 Tax=Penicillium brevicompactum TaxID=5074 RepID=UPI00254050F9|nr:Nucleotide-binding alpha-beta plait [Penicillium brevicompactum]KAJ5319496.1 Nucleotide-binding alpha-beta plait [Penicillium brevicompactum]
MAPDKKISKRKAAPVAADSPAKKTKKAEAKTEAPKADAPKSKADKPESTRQMRPRKRAADFLTDEETEKPAPAVKADKKTEKKAAEKPAAKKSKKEETKASPAAKKAAPKKAAAKKTEKKTEPVESEDEEEAEVPAVTIDEESGSEGEDDQTANLIKGFESSDDEDDSGEGYKEGEPIPKAPDTKKAERKLAKALAKELKKNGPPRSPVPRIPHGFYEHQMKAYFSQFGDITRLRLSRNRHTGRSKHYAFIEFSSTTVAKIVAETMDNYLMYGHIVKCKFVPKEQLHAEVFKGANRRFKVTPWNRIEKKRLEKGKTREQWTKSNEAEQKKRLAKAKKLKALGYELPLPQLRSVDDVPVQDVTKAIEGETELVKAIEPAVEEPKAVEAAPTDDTPKKTKKGKNTEEKEVVESPAAKSPAAKKGKATKKAAKKVKA